MPANPADLILDAWKRQLDTAMKVTEAMVEGGERAREIQLEAAVDAHAWLEANRKALAAAPSAAELLAMQSRFVTEDLGKAAQYWSRLGANARDTQARILQILAEAPLGAPSALPLDAGFKQWLESLKWLSRAGNTTTTAPT